MESTSKTSKKKSPRKRSAAASGSGRGRRSSGEGAGSSGGQGRSGGLGDWLSKTGQRVADAGSNLSMPQLGNIESAMENRPIVLGAVGIAIGMVIGAMLPSMTGMMHASGGSSRSRASTRH